VLVGVGAVAAAVLGVLAWRGETKSWSRHEKCEGYEACAARCEAGVAAGCYEAGDALDEGEYIPRDATKAVELYTRGCALGHSSSCSRVAGKHWLAERREEAVAMERRGFAVARSGCEARNVDECFSLLFDLHYGWDRKTKEGQDEERARDLEKRITPVYERLCERCRSTSAPATWTHRIVGTQAA
jgi:TPR repeat protein